MNHPYMSLDDRAFWKSAVCTDSALDIDDLWRPAFAVEPEHRIATYGSCFAQHIGKAIQKNGYQWLDTEPAPPGLGAEFEKQYNYKVFTCRTGNIYTVTLLQQWIEWALGRSNPADECWEQGGRYYDPFRPRVEPNGFASPDEMIASRKVTIEAMRNSIVDSDIFVFTLGLTESWFNVELGHEYPMCPGTVAGEFDENLHRFVNQDYATILAALEKVRNLLQELNPQIKMLLTVSPVPLTATNSGQHVLVATTQSKAILRAVVAQASSQFENVDYFPSFEMITGAPYKAGFYEDNLRSVKSEGVQYVMSRFFSGLHWLKHGETAAPLPTSSVRAESANNSTQGEDDVVCEEELLNAFHSTG